jgi:DNA replication protein DnaC
MIFSMQNIPEEHRECRLDTFEWKGKEKLKEAIDAFVEGKRKGLVLLGNPGVGKTHLMVAMYIRLQELGNLPGSDVLYFDFQEMLNAFRAGFNEKIRADAFMARICSMKYLLIDDIKPEQMGAFWRQILEQFLEYSYNKQTKIVLSTNAEDSGQMIERCGLADYHVSRLGEMTDTFVLKGKDYRLEK